MKFEFIKSKLSRRSMVIIAIIFSFILMGATVFREPVVKIFNAILDNIIEGREEARLAKEDDKDNEYSDLEIDGESNEIDETDDTDRIVAELNKKVEESMMNISMNSAPVFQNGTSKGNLSITNNTVNRHPQVVSIYRDDTNELIYRSGIIPIGHEIENANLSKVLKKGEYQCTAYFESVDADTKRSLGKAGAKIKITILN